MGSMAERRRSSRLMTPKTPRFWPEMKTWILRVVAAVSLVDIGPLDRTAGERLGAVKDVPQGVTVVGVIGQCLGVQHEQTAGGPVVVGDDGSLHSELVRCAGLALADALHLRSMEGIKLPAALALLLRADLGGSAQREGERLLQGWLAFDLAANVPDDAAEPAAQDAQLPLMPPELFGMGVAARHHRGGLGHARIGLPQPDAVPGRQAVEPLDGRMQQLGIGRKGDGLRLHRGVDRDPLEVLATQRAGPVRHPQALGQQQLQFVAEPLAPMAQVRALVREGVLEKLFTVKNWKYGSWTQRSHTPSSDSP
jgi:hypothetical protein